mmetsp:Transcript_13694/g.9863  ORF Transcript_13694/g.9863 Transcript_13694/m.9863 type:complete len:128 (-) Transcript_13694:459-842(-)
MDFISYFSNLKVIVLINQGITEIEGLDKLPHLEKLWLNENLIEQISGLQKQWKLKELFLGHNRIKKLRGLDSLVSLEKLWLEENRVETLEGLQNNTKLRELNLAGNCIEAIGMGLDFLVALEELNVA